MIDRFEQEEFQQILDQLDAEERVIIYGIYFENKTQVRLARIMGISKQLLAYKMEMILKKIRKMYQNDFKKIKFFSLE